MHLYDNPWYVQAWGEWLGWMKDWPVGTIAGVTLLVFILGIAAAVPYGLFRLLDTIGTPKRVGQGCIVGKWVADDSEGWLRPDYLVKVRLTDGRHSKIFSGFSAHKEARSGRPVDIWYQRGRFSGTVYIRSYAHADRP